MTKATKRSDLTALEAGVRPSTVALAQRMRRAPTASERRMWEMLKGRAFGVRFHRQEVVYGWIADFFCRSHGIVVEVDGPDHDTREQWDHDRLRDEVMEGHGLIVVRVAAQQVWDDPESVRESVRAGVSRARTRVSTG